MSKIQLSTLKTRFSILGKSHWPLNRKKMIGSFIHNDFPALQRKVNANKFVYLDNAATAHKPACVIQAMQDFYSSSYATVHRSLYQQAEGATELYENSRAKIATFINASCPEEIIFTYGTTDGINGISQSLSKILQTNHEILLSQVEHHANLLPWQRIANERGAKLKFIDLDKETLILKNPLNYLTPKTKIIAITLDSNVLGPVWGQSFDHLKKLIEAAHAQDTLVLLDAAQAIAHMPLDVQQLNVDFLVFSGHKLYGPTGIGAAYINKKHHDWLAPWRVGGSMVFEVNFDKASWAPAPQKFEAGTPPITEVIGLGATIDYLTANTSWKEIRNNGQLLNKALIGGLEQIKDVTIVGNNALLAEHGHLVSIASKVAHPHDLSACLSNVGVATRAGHLCAQPLISMLGHTAVLRISTGIYNTLQDIEIFLQELERCIQLLK